MADNVELKIEQLTDAIRSLYTRPSMSQSDISSLLSNLSQRIEASADINLQKLTEMFTLESKRILEEKNRELKEQISSFEGLLKQISGQAANPKMSMEVTRILSDINSIQSKLSNQDIAIQKINQGITSSRSVNAGNEIIKLANDFAAFSRGFDNITATLNKNFSEFLEQVKTFSSKDELARVQIELDTISGNINSVISAIAIIDHKYQDLTGLIEVFNKKETAFSESMNEIRNYSRKTESFQELVSGLCTRDDIKILSERVNYVNETLSKTRQSIDDSLNQNNEKSIAFIGTIESKLNDLAGNKNVEQFRADLQEVSNKLISQNEINKEDLLLKLKENLTSIKAESDKNVQEQFFDYTNGVNEGLSLISAQINKVKETYDSLLNQKTFEMDNNSALVLDKLDIISKNIDTIGVDELAKTVDEIKSGLGSFGSNIGSLETGISSLKNHIEALNSGNLAAIQQPIREALSELKDKTIAPQLKQIDETVSETTKDLAQAINQIKENFNTVALNSNIETLASIRNMIPTLADKIDGFKQSFVSQNDANINGLKNSFFEISEAIKNYLEQTTNKLQEEIKKTYDESISSIKLDLQTLSNHFIESVENINTNISKEFETHRADINKILATIESDRQKGLKGEIGEELITKLDDLKNDIIEGILGNSKNTKAVVSALEEKINELIEQNSTIDNEKNEIIYNKLKTVTEKIERTNLQQIHNAKELMDEIQNTSTSISAKLSDVKDNSIEIEEIIDKLNTIETKFLLNSTKTDMAEGFERVIAALEAIPKDREEMPQFNSYLTKIDEYLTNIDYLKNNFNADVREYFESENSKLVQKVKEELNEEIEKISKNLAKIISSNEENENYSYSLQDVESDIAKMRLSLEKNFKGENYKEFINRLIELKNINLENNKLNHLVETNIGRMNNWLKNVTGRLEELSMQVEQSQNLSMQEVKTRLIHSEKTGSGQKLNLEDLNDKLDALLKRGAGEIDSSQFIDVAYDNMKQTKTLMIRVDNIENKIDKIQSYMEKIIAYIEE